MYGGAGVKDCNVVNCFFRRAGACGHPQGPKYVNHVGFQVCMNGTNLLVAAQVIVDREFRKADLQQGNGEACY